MVKKAGYILMNQGLNQFQAVFMAGQIEVRKFMGKSKVKEEKEKI